MIKDNHVDYAGSIEAAITKAVTYLKETGRQLRIEVETRNRAEVEEVLRVGQVDVILLDNFPPDGIRDMVRLINGRFVTEASGGINETNLRAYAETGVDYISSGALTHQIKSLDLSLKATNNKFGGQCSKHIRSVNILIFRGFSSIPNRGRAGFSTRGTTLTRKTRAPATLKSQL